MHKSLKRVDLLAGALLVSFLTWVFLRGLPLLETGFTLISIIPTEENLHWVSSSSGGQIRCGLPQSTVWLEIPTGFASEGGAEFHCDPVDVLSRWRGAFGVWEDRGYLIGFYATGIPILKPLELVFEVDPAQVADICSNCFSGRYYDAAIGEWQNLPTQYQAGSLGAYVKVQFDRYLPTAGYPAYEDRFLIALFTEGQATTTPTSTRSPTATSSPTLTVSSTPSPSPSSSPAWTAMASTPLLSPSPTSMPETPTPTVALEETPANGSEPPEPPIGGVVAALSVFTVALLAFSLIRRWRRP